MISDNEFNERLLAEYQEDVKVLNRINLNTIEDIIEYTKGTLKSAVDKEREQPEGALRFYHAGTAEASRLFLVLLVWFNEKQKKEWE